MKIYPCVLNLCLSDEAMVQQLNFQKNEIDHRTMPGKKMLKYDKSLR